MSELTWDDVLDRIRRGEDEATELKLWRGFPKRVAEAVCAFANTDGGLLILGVDDSGQIQGVDEDSEAVQEKLTSLLHNGLNAPVRARLGRHAEWNGTRPELESSREGGFVRLTLRRRSIRPPASS